MTNQFMKDSSNTNIKEKETLRSNAKSILNPKIVDFRTLSNIQSQKNNFQTTSNKESNTSNIQYYFSQNKDLGATTKLDSMFKKNKQKYCFDVEKNSRTKKLQLLKNLLNNNKKFQESLEFVENSNSIDEMAYEAADKLKIVSKIESWKNNFKEYLLLNFLPGILSDHEFNLKSLNNYLRSSLNINITESMPNYFPKNYNEEIDLKFNQFNLYNLSQQQNIVCDMNEENFLNIFYTENDKIIYLLRKIDEKINSIKQHQKPIKEKKIENKVEKPFLFINNDFTKITEDINYSNTHLEDHLNSIKNLLHQRIFLNKRFTHRLIKIENENHSYLLK